MPNQPAFLVAGVGPKMPTTHGSRLPGGLKKCPNPPAFLVTRLAEIVNKTADFESPGPQRRKSPFFVLAKSESTPDPKFLLWFVRPWGGQETSVRADILPNPPGGRRRRLGQLTSVYHDNTVD